MRIQTHIWTITISIIGLTLISCHRDLKTGKTLSKKEREYIKGIGILDDQESIILFDSQGGGFNGLKTSGNFFTDKRIASYWIDSRDKNKTTIEYAFYPDIDTIRRYPKYKALTLASYLEVQRRNGTKFRVYVDADSLKTWDFFNRALEQWKRKNAL
jgi:hypothetical protein